MKNGCCIVETRPLKNLVDIIESHHLKYLPPCWGLTIYCSSDNYSALNGVDFGRETNIHLVDTPVTTTQHYSDLLKSLTFWDSLTYDKVLIFQPDSKLLKTGIDEFLKYDYIGAPFKRGNYASGYASNGGLSLRNVEIMKYICRKYDLRHRRRGDGNRQEDIAFCRQMNKHKIGKLAPREACKTFSVESVFELGTLGVHNIERWLPAKRCKRILNQYNV